MTQVSVAEAGTRLRKLVEEAANGEEVILTENDLPVARLVAVAGELGPEASRPRPKRGSGRGLVIYMAPDFDAPLEDFKEYME